MKKCCDPRRAPFPSGWAWAHALDCPVSPGQHWYDLDKVAAETKSGPLLSWLKHPPGHACGDCRYIEAHLDDLDDEAVG